MQTPCKILLAEDDADDRELFKQFFKKRKDIVITHIAEDGVALLDFLNTMTNDNDLPDIIILDQNMPKKNGFHTYAALKAEPRFAHIPVAIYSTYLDENFKTTASDAGVAITFVKPSAPEGYDEMMNKLIEYCC